jgi:subtilisin family serine protease
MSPLDLVKLTALMDLTSGSSKVKIGLIDGPISTKHPDMAGLNLYEIPGAFGAKCTQADNAACLHGTFIAGILSANRKSPAPAICPNCTLECIEAGARIINLSLALARPSTKGEKSLEESLDQAVRRGVIVVAAAGNQGMLGSTAITRHPWVIPVVACDLHGRPLNESNIGSSVGRRGLRAPGDSITSLGSEGHSLTLGGTSVAVPFVTGAIALLWSEFPNATAAQIQLAITQSTVLRRASVVPPLLDAAAAHQILGTSYARRQES